MENQILKYLDIIWFGIFFTFFLYMFWICCPFWPSNQQLNAQVCVCTKLGLDEARLDVIWLHRSTELLHKVQF